MIYLSHNACVHGRTALVDGAAESVRFGAIIDEATVAKRASERGCVQWLLAVGSIYGESLAIRLHPVC